MTNMPLVRLVRPGHWIKNIFVFLPVIFAVKMNEPLSWLRAGIATIVFCLISSSIYIINDIRDRKADRLHPTKKNRPLASGALSIGFAIGLAIALACVALAGPFLSLGVIEPNAAWQLSAILLAYFGMQLAYTFFLKNKMIVDVICIALGFVLRATAGAVAIEVEISPWLFVCTFTICLFMGFCKRSNENVTLEDLPSSASHRATLAGYTPELLTHLITLSASVAVIGFILYSQSPSTTARFGSDYLVYTLPLFIYGIFRFAMLSMQAKYSDPTTLLLKDWPLQATVILWLATTVGIILWGRDLANCL